MSEINKKKVGRPRKVRSVEEASSPVEAPAVPPTPIVAPSAPSTPVSAPVHQGPPRVDIVTFWRMQHAAAEMRAAKAEAETLRITKLYILSLLDAKNRVLDTEKKQNEAKKKAEARENEFLSFRRIIESQVGGRSLADVQIHPESGEIQFVK